jgi:hypothetical protein
MPSDADAAGTLAVTIVAISVDDRYGPVPSLRLEA